MMRIAIIVRGGVVQDVITDEDCEVSLLDYDNFGHGDSADELRHPRIAGAVGVDAVDEALTAWELAIQEAYGEEQGS